MRDKVWQRHDVLLNMDILIFACMSGNHPRVCALHSIPDYILIVVLYLLGMRNVINRGAIHLFRILHTDIQFFKLVGGISPDVLEIKFTCFMSRVYLFMCTNI